MNEYLTALRTILENGELRKNRTNFDTIGIFGYQSRYDLRSSFPAITTKKLAWRPVVAELLWFLEGSTDERRLAEIQFGTTDISKQTIWTANADNQGKALGYHNDDESKQLGPIYGYQWRNFGGESWDEHNHNPCHGVDQVKTLINTLRDDPHSRRHILSAWDARQVDKMALPPCHVMSQFYVNNNNELNCQLYQRSADFGLGVPFNIASYSLLTHMLAQLTGLEVGEFIHTIGDAHIYTNHVAAIEEQLTREPYVGPILEMPEFSTLDDILTTSVEDYKLLNYNYHPHIKMDMAV